MDGNKNRYNIAPTVFFVIVERTELACLIKSGSLLSCYLFNANVMGSGQDNPIH